MEAEEAEEQTALRELREETGLCAKLIPGKQALIEYDIPPYTRKQVVLFLGETDGSVIPQETEILEHRWVRAKKLPEYLHPDTYNAIRSIIEPENSL